MKSFLSLVFAMISMLSIAVAYALDKEVAEKAIAGMTEARDEIKYDCIYPNPFIKATKGK